MNNDNLLDTNRRGKRNKKGKKKHTHAENHILNIKYVEIHSAVYNDWILTAKWINDSNGIAAVSMHNTLILWTDELFFIDIVICIERCISYCATIVYNKWDDLVVLSGTVFSEILIWTPNHFDSEEEPPLCSVLYRLRGHKVIYLRLYNSYLSYFFGYKTSPRF